MKFGCTAFSYSIIVYFCLSSVTIAKQISLDTLFDPWQSLQQVHQDIACFDAQKCTCNNFITTFKPDNDTKQFPGQSLEAILEPDKKQLQIMCNNHDPLRNNASNFALANNLFDWCFTMPTSELFLNMHFDQASYPTLRFLYTALWSILSEKGWIDWHDMCLKQLKQEHDAGKAIMYIGGGCDIWQLLRYGIYNVTIIDPMLPMQERYYIKDYNFLLSGTGKNNGLEDEIIMQSCGETITLKRVVYEKKEKYITVDLPSGQARCIPLSITEWAVFDEQQNQRGKIVFGRRMATQHDFAMSQDNVLLLSWNELACIIDGTWKIDTTIFLADTKIFVKQLKKPVTKEIIDTMCMAVKHNKSNFRFISLGSNIT